MGSQLRNIGKYNEILRKTLVEPGTYGVLIGIVMGWYSIFGPFVRTFYRGQTMCSGRFALRLRETIGGSGSSPH